MKTGNQTIKTIENVRKSSIVRTSITLPTILEEAGNRRVASGGYTSFSDYIQDLIRQDARQHSMAA